MFISEYRVHGAHALTPVEIETAVYPFLGPERTETDIKAACTALEEAYRAKGFGAISVQYAARADGGGVIDLQVREGTVARLRVKGARYFSPAKIKAAAPSLAEGGVINFNDVNRDMIALNQQRDSSVTPSLKPAAEPGSFDVDLNVKDSPPVHASVELNNYRSPNTTPLRVTASVSDANLAQSGNGAGLSFQVAPERPKDSEVLTAYYLAHFAGLQHLSFLVQGTKLDSDVSTLGGATVAGPGQTVELRLILALPPGDDPQNFYQSASLSFNYKHYQQTLTTGSDAGAGTIVTPITYYPLTAAYSATLNGLSGKGSVTEFNTGLSLNFRGVGSGPSVFDQNRFGSDGNFISLRSTLAQTQELPLGLQAYAKLQGQIANEPLISSEQFSGGGSQTVRGYLESETLGDDGGFASLELRSPSILSLLGKKDGDWRVYIFGEGGELTLLDPLPDQQSRFDLASIGVGTRFNVGDHLNGQCDAGYPLIDETYTKAHDLRVTFRLGLNY